MVFLNNGSLRRRSRVLVWNNYKLEVRLTLMIWQVQTLRATFAIQYLNNSFLTLKSESKRVNYTGQKRVKFTTFWLPPMGPLKIQKGLNGPQLVPKNIQKRSNCLRSVPQKIQNRSNCPQLVPQFFLTF